MGYVTRGDKKLKILDLIFDKMLDFWTCINFAMGTLINFIQC